MKAYPFWIIRRHHPQNGIEYRAQTKWVGSLMDAKIYTNRSIGGGWSQWGMNGPLNYYKQWLIEKIPVEVKLLP